MTIENGNIARAPFRFAVSFKSVRTGEERRVFVALEDAEAADVAAHAAGVRRGPWQCIANAHALRRACIGLPGDLAAGFQAIERVGGKNV